MKAHIIRNPGGQLYFGTIRNDRLQCITDYYNFVSCGNTPFGDWWRDQEIEGYSCVEVDINETSSDANSKQLITEKYFKSNGFTFFDTKHFGGASDPPSYWRRDKITVVKMDGMWTIQLSNDKDQYMKAQFKYVEEFEAFVLRLTWNKNETQS